MRLTFRNLAGISWILGTWLFGPDTLVLAQVSPAEITNPRLRAAEQAYFRRLVDLSRAITQGSYPFPFALARHPGQPAQKQSVPDTRGLEFVIFHDRMILKISGDYRAAFNAGMLTQNQRANRVLKEVVVPILQLIPAYFSPEARFDGFGFEISYHVRTGDRSYAYEGDESLTIVFDKADALRYLHAQDESERQETLNGSEIYVSGNELGLALGARDPFEVDGLDKPRPGHSGRGGKESGDKAFRQPASTTSDLGLRAIGLDQDPIRPPAGRGETAQCETQSAVAGPPASPADVAALQTKYQSQLEALVLQGKERYHLVDYAPPSFVLFQNRAYFQLTLRNPTVFERETTSIYKRAAQSFDLFLAPFLKPILDQVPRSEDVIGLDVTVLNGFTAKTVPSSESVEFLCPLGPLRQFVNAEITNQDLINQSVVLVNGVRIALNLQQVE